MGKACSASLARQFGHRIIPVLILLIVGLADAQAASYSWLRAESGEWGIDQVHQLPEENWQAFDASRSLNLGYSDDTFWVRVEVPASDQRRLFQLGYPLLDSVDVFWFAGDRLIERHLTGDLRDFSSRPVFHRNFLFPLPLENQPLIAYFRIHTDGSVLIPLSLTETDDFLRQDQIAFGFQAIYAGIILAMAFYNLFVFFAVRQITYLWYVITVLVAGLNLLNFHGLLFQWWWPGVPEINQYFTGPMISGGIIFSSLFTVSLLSLKRYSPWSYRFFQVIIGLSILALLIGLSGAYNASITFVTMLVAVVTPVAWWVGLLMWRRGHVLGGFYVLAWTPLLAGHMVLALSRAGYLPSTFLVEIAPQVGVALEVILLSFALAYRINLERSRRQQAQEEALRVQQEANQTLEGRVQERTQELEQANRQLHAISHTDGLTGVANRRRFDGQFEEEWKRACRNQLPISLLLLDIDHFKRVNDELGHLVGDDCLIRVAQTCRGELKRPADLLARYGGEEFVVLLPETDWEGALQLAEAMRGAVADNPVDCEQADEPVPLTVSVGVATASPEAGLEQVELIRRADEALYAAKSAGRNRVMLFRDGESVPATECLSS